MQPFRFQAALLIKTTGRVREIASTTYLSANRFQKSKRAGKVLLSFVGKAALALLMVIGGGTLYDRAVGDGPLPRLKDLSKNASHLQVLKERIPPRSGLKPEQQWQAMAESLILVRAISPEIADWVEQTYQTGRIQFSLWEPFASVSKQTNPQLSIMAMYNPFFQKLYIGESFWDLNNANRAAILAHEYRHFRQNLPKMVSEFCVKTVDGDLFKYESPIEDEAFQYQKLFYTALGSGSEQIDGYLQSRGLQHQAEETNMTVMTMPPEPTPPPVVFPREVCVSINPLEGRYKSSKKRS